VSPFRKAEELVRLPLAVDELIGRERIVVYERIQGGHRRQD
jgi:hypothetical protein